MASSSAAAAAAATTTGRSRNQATTTPDKFAESTLAELHQIAKGNENLDKFLDGFKQSLSAPPVSEPRQMGILGKSGIGKTTLFNLLGTMSELSEHDRAEEIRAAATATTTTSSTTDLSLALSHNPLASEFESPFAATTAAGGAGTAGNVETKRAKNMSEVQAILRARTDYDSPLRIRLNADRSELANYGLVEGSEGSKRMERELEYIDAIRGRMSDVGTLRHIVQERTDEFHPGYMFFSRKISETEASTTHLVSIKYGARFEARVKFGSAASMLQRLESYDFHMHKALCTNSDSYDSPIRQQFNLMKTLLKRLTIGNEPDDNVIDLRLPKFGTKFQLKKSVLMMSNVELIITATAADSALSERMYVRDALYHALYGGITNEDGIPFFPGSYYNETGTYVSYRKPKAQTASSSSSSSWSSERLSAVTACPESYLVEDVSASFPSLLLRDLNLVLMDVPGTLDADPVRYALTVNGLASCTALLALPQIDGDETVLDMLRRYIIEPYLRGEITPLGVVFNAETSGSKDPRSFDKLDVNGWVARGNDWIVPEETRFATEFTNHLIRSRGRGTDEVKQQLRRIKDRGTMLINPLLMTSGLMGGRSIQNRRNLYDLDKTSLAQDILPTQDVEDAASAYTRTEKFLELLCEARPFSTSRHISHIMYVMTSMRVALSADVPPSPSRFPSIVHLAETCLHDNPPTAAATTTTTTSTTPSSRRHHHRSDDGNWEDDDDDMEVVEVSAPVPPRQPRQKRSRNDPSSTSASHVRGVLFTPDVVSACMQETASLGGETTSRTFQAHRNDVVQWIEYSARTYELGRQWSALFQQIELEERFANKPQRAGSMNKPANIGELKSRLEDIKAKIVKYNKSHNWFPEKDLEQTSDYPWKLILDLPTFDVVRQHARADYFREEFAYLVASRVAPVMTKYSARILDSLAKRILQSVPIEPNDADWYEKYGRPTLQDLLREELQMECPDFQLTNSLVRHNDDRAVLEAAKQSGVTRRRRTLFGGFAQEPASGDERGRANLSLMAARVFKTFMEVFDRAFQTHLCFASEVPQLFPDALDVAAKGGEGGDAKSDVTDNAAIRHFLKEYDAGLRAVQTELESSKILERAVASALWELEARVVDRLPHVLKRVQAQFKSRLDDGGLSHTVRSTCREEIADMDRHLHNQTAQLQLMDANVGGNGAQGDGADMRSRLRLNSIKRDFIVRNNRYAFPGARTFMNQDRAKMWDKQAHVHRTIRHRQFIQGLKAYLESAGMDRANRESTAGLVGKFMQALCNTVVTQVPSGASRRGADDIPAGMLVSAGLCAFPHINEMQFQLNGSYETYVGVSDADKTFIASGVRASRQLLASWVSGGTIRESLAETLAKDPYLDAATQMFLAVVGFADCFQIPVCVKIDAADDEFWVYPVIYLNDWCKSNSATFVEMEV